MHVEPSVDHSETSPRNQLGNARGTGQDNALTQYHRPAAQADIVLSSPDGAWDVPPTDLFDASVGPHLCVPPSNQNSIRPGQRLVDKSAFTTQWVDRGEVSNISLPRAMPLPQTAVLVLPAAAAGTRVVSARRT